jgi:hypothetical protein
VFGCLDKQADVFLHDVPMPCETSKGQKAPLSLSWLLFFIKKSQLHYKRCKHATSYVVQYL